ncbi:uncharacterized protein LOC115888251 isoform X2 [Sitophilus oryzae]|uniref:Uncharacterized protein LOC115888251 isoform X2 n=1 Tax=Sitophilus oryzae TaxID=7048 RepID=A0A6J2YKW2_SITOR|nr:uncharacterized protein LOC115888251 isoform X2 [Sitophilus oryzae]
MTLKTCLFVFRSATSKKTYVYADGCRGVMSKRNYYSDPQTDVSVKDPIDPRFQLENGDLKKGNWQNLEQDDAENKNHFLNSISDIFDYFY